MKKILILVTFIMAFSLFSLEAQSFLNNDDLLVNGFSLKISGYEFDYHSCIPGLHESILIRATTGKDVMEWETAAVNPEKDKSYAAFI